MMRRGADSKEEYLRVAFWRAAHIIIKEIRKLPMR
jgi:hypothetical protein